MYPNRALKNLINDCIELAAGENIEKVLSEKANKFFLGLNEKFKVKFPNLINDIGVVDVSKI